MDPKTSPANWSEIFKTWSAPIGTLAGALATFLITKFGVESLSAQLLGYSIVVILIALGVLVYKKIRNKQQAIEARIAQRNIWLQSNKRTAFRGLYPYGESDHLPGTQRQREAGRLVVQLTDPDFSFGILCGDSGCGKTSLLRSELQSKLKEEGRKAQPGFRVLYVPNPRDLATDATPEGRELEPSARLERSLNALRQALATAAEALPLILIIDQFEELFIEFTDRKFRLRIGQFLNEQIQATPQVKVLCAIRRDYLVDVGDLAPALPDPISVKTLFPLKNFTLGEATEIINECAMYDGILPDDEFASTLALNLAEGGFVRPPELQIICTALGGTLTMEEYRLSGGAKGILSHYIGNAVSLCGAPNLGRMVLRALCDFPARAKRNPQSVSMLWEAVGASGPSTSGDSPEQTNAEKALTSPSSMQSLLDQFEAARLIVSEDRSGEETKYSLVHDYLVDAVGLATSDVSTRTEEANQILQYYRAEYVRDNKTRLPARKRRLAKKYADRKMLAEPQVKKLMTASLISQLINIARLSLIIIAVAGLLYSIASIQRTWHREPLGSHWAGYSNITLEGNISLQGQYVFTGVDLAAIGSYLHRWDLKTGKLIDTVPGKTFQLSPKGNYLTYSKDGKQRFVRHLATGREYLLPYTFSREESGRFTSRNVVFNKNEDVLAEIEAAPQEVRQLITGTPVPRQVPITVSLWSLARENEIAQIRNCGENGDVINASVVSEDRVVLTCRRTEDKGAIILWRGKNEAPAKLAEYSKALPSSFQISQDGSLIATFEAQSANQRTVVLWDTKSAAHIRSSQPITGTTSRFYPTAFFSNDGRYLLMKPSVMERRLMSVLQTSDLRAPVSMSADAQYFASEHPTGQLAEHEYVAWHENDTDTLVWELGQKEPRVIKGLQLFSKSSSGNEPDDDEFAYEVNSIVISRDGSRAVLLRERPNQVELWDFLAGRKIGIVDVSGTASSIGLTEDYGTIKVSGKDNSITLFTLDKGERLLNITSRDGGLTGDGGDGVVYYDPVCHSVNVWTIEGAVVRYRQGHDILHRENWFWPTTRCAL